MKTIKLTDKEYAMLTSALNAYYLEADTQLRQNYIQMFDGTKRGIGDIERDILKKRIEWALPLLKKLDGL